MQISPMMRVISSVHASHHLFSKCIGSALRRSVIRSTALQDLHLETVYYNYDQIGILSEVSIIMFLPVSWSLRFTLVTARLCVSLELRKQTQGGLHIVQDAVSDDMKTKTITYELSHRHSTIN